jgi:hypothetical protein
MPFGSRRAFRVGPFLGVKLSKRGPGLFGRLGLVSTKSRIRKLQIRLPFGIYSRQKWRRSGWRS